MSKEQKYPRLSVNMHPEVSVLLKQMMDDRECSATEAIRQCIVVTSYIHEQWRNGNTIKITHPETNFYTILTDACPPQTDEAKSHD